ncbi:hypothetical protein Hamer_G011904, partial [Homarus americanus]
LLSVLLLVALQQVTADDKVTVAPDTDDAPDISLATLSNPLEGITLPDNVLSIGFESVGVFLLLAGLVAFIAYVVLGIDKTVATAYSYSAPTASNTQYTSSGGRYTDPASGYTQEETYNFHRNIEEAASKYQ